MQMALVSRKRGRTGPYRGASPIFPPFYRQTPDDMLY